MQAKYHELIMKCLLKLSKALSSLLQYASLCLLVIASVVLTLVQAA
jgi:hypothetical protein